MLKYKKSGKGNIGLILILFLVLCGVVSGAIYLFDSFGIMNAKEIFYPLLKKVKIVKEPEVKTGNLIESEILALREENLKKREDLLKKQSIELEEKDKQLEEKEKNIMRMEQEFLNKKKTYETQLKKAESEEEKLVRQAFYFSNMKPDESAKKLAEMPDELVIDILKKMKDQKTAAIILMKMDDVVAARIMRKMSR